MNIFGNRVFMIGDKVRFAGRGGSARTRSNVWELVEIKEPISRHGAIAVVKLLEGGFNDSCNHEHGPGYVHKYWLKDLKHCEEAV